MHTQCTHAHKRCRSGCSDAAGAAWAFDMVFCAVIFYLRDTGGSRTNRRVVSVKSIRAVAYLPSPQSRPQETQDRLARSTYSTHDIFTPLFTMRTDNVPLDPPPTPPVSGSGSRGRLREQHRKKTTLYFVLSIVFGASGGFHAIARIVELCFSEYLNYVYWRLTACTIGGG